MQYCPIFFPFVPVKVRFITLSLWYNEGIRVYLKKITAVLQAQAIPAAGYQKEQVLEYAAQAESYSNHPIAKSILATYGKPIW